MNTTPYQFRYARLVYLRWLLAAPTLIALLGLTTNYTFARVNPFTTPIVALVDTVPTVWTLVFGAPLVVLLAALIWRQLIAQAYVLVSAAFAFYAATLLFGLLMTGTGWATASLAAAAAASSMTTGLIYAKGR